MKVLFTLKPLKILMNTIKKTTNQMKQKSVNNKEREMLIGLLDWMNKVAQDNPMAFETDTEDIVDMYLEEIKREDYQQERSYSEEEVEAIAKDAYKNYEKITNDFQLENPIDDFIIKTIRGEMIKIETEDGDDYRILTQKEFIKKIKTNNEFAKKWGET
jgi:isopropylmalate/homocitrate/citramalate synthase